MININDGSVLNGFNKTTGATWVSNCVYGINGLLVRLVGDNRPAWQGGSVSFDLDNKTEGKQWNLKACLYLNLLKMTEPWSNSYPELRSSAAMTEASPKVGGLRPISLQFNMMCFPWVLRQNKSRRDQSSVISLRLDPQSSAWACHQSCPTVWMEGDTPPIQSLKVYVNFVS